MAKLYIQRIPFASQHYQQSLQLRSLLLRQPLGLTLSAEDVIGEEKQWHWGAFAGDDLIACVVLRPISPSVCQLRQMAVSESLQGTGVGRSLIEAAESEALKQGIKRIYLNARENAVGFYQKVGYQVCGDKLLLLGLTHYPMAKELGHHL